jgi:hypothetical protein
LNSVRSIASSNNLNYKACLLAGFIVLKQKKSFSKGKEQNDR